LLSAIGSGLTIPFLLVYLNRVRGIELEIAGVIVATIAFAALAGNPTAGVLIDRIGSRRALFLGLAVAATGTAGIAFVETPWEGFAAVGTAGFGVSLIWPSLDSLLAVTVRPNQRSSAFAVRYATMNAGFGSGALVAASLVDFDSPGRFQLLYLLDAASFIAFIPLLLLLKGVGDRPEPEPEAPRAGYREVFRDRVFLRVAALTTLLCGAGYAQMNSAFPAFATGPGGISAGALALVFAVNTFIVCFMQLPVLRLAQGRRRTAALVLVFVLFATAWAITLGAGMVEGAVAAVLAFALAEAVFATGETAVAPSVGPMVNDLAPDRLRGRYNAVNTLAWTTGFIIGPLMAGFALGAGQETPLFLGLIAACCLGAFGAYRLRPHLPRGVDEIGPWRSEPDVD
jgi:MFS family permease